MKNTIKILLVAAMSFMLKEAAAVTHVIDLRTGVYDNTNTLIPLGAYDDTWTTCLGSLTPPPPSSYVPAKAGFLVTYPGQSPAVRWACGVPIPFPEVPGDSMNYFKTTFYVAACDVQSAVLNFTQLGADNVMDMIDVNGNIHNVNYGFCWYCNPTAFTNNFSITLGSGEITPGWNTIIIRISAKGGYDGLLIDGNLTIQTSYATGILPGDVNGNYKNEFCIGENVFLNETSGFNGAYYLEIGQVNGSTVTPLAVQGTTGWTSGTPNGVNITSLFANHPTTPVTFLPNTTYRITYTIDDPCDITITIDFTYKCCDSSTDPTFMLSTIGAHKLEAYPLANGSHTWTVYTSPNGSGGPYTYIGTYNTPTLELDVNGPCYYVEHEMTNACGTTCSALSVCESACDDAECKVSAPTGLYRIHYDATHDQFYWNSVSNAASYVLVLTLGDALCCGDQGGGGQQAPPVITFPVNYPFETVDLSVLPWPLIVDGEPYCYSWYVYAICRDGSTSMASTVLCSGGGGGIPNGKPGSGTPGGNQAEVPAGR